MIDSIQEIRKALDKDCYLAALALSLTLPDICSQVENAVMDGNRTLYINWFNSHAEYDDFHFPMAGFETQTFDGEMCYSLRCKVLHNGNTEVTNPKLKVLVDSFELLKPDDQDYKPGYTYIKKNTAGWNSKGDYLYRN